MSRVAEGHFRRKREAPLILRGSTSQFRGHPQTLLATSLYEDPSAGLHEDASARLREHPVLLILDLAPTLAAVQFGRPLSDPAGGYERRHIDKIDRIFEAPQCGSAAESGRRGTGLLRRA